MSNNTLSEIARFLLVSSCENTDPLTRERDTFSAFRRSLLSVIRAAQSMAAEQWPGSEEQFLLMLSSLEKDIRTELKHTDW